MNQAELAREREYTQMVQGLLYSVINASKGNAAFQEESIQTILNDAWEEMRLKPTALSQQDIDQLQTEINRYAARKSFSEGRAAQYECMLANPFFARVDFTEEPDGTQETPPEKEKIVIGLYSLKDAERRIVVHDWRAPICSLYYDCLPGPASYVCPDGTIRGVLSLKRQYAMDKGKLKYYVDTDYSIDDSMLLDILSGATSSHMRQIVATIQSEQNAAIRHDNARVLSVIGGAGSGKTSVAMHRAAYLMYRYRDQLSSECIAVISPSQAFSEYISQVLPSLGEKNTQSHTVHDILSKVIGRKIETPVAQYETLLSGVPELRHQSVAYKAGAEFLQRITDYVERFREHGPYFTTLSLGDNVLISRAELEHMYREEFKILSPAQRLNRLNLIVESRLENWEKTLYPQYEKQLIPSYRDKELAFATRMAVAQRLHPLRAQARQLFDLNPLNLFAQAMRGAPAALKKAAYENANAGLIWWEDAPAIGYIMLRLGFVKPDTGIRHLLIDEAQDYPDIFLKFLAANYPSAHATLLGDPNQRTLSSLPPCDPQVWGSLMGSPDAPLVELRCGYRSTVQIGDYCNAFLGKEAVSNPYGRSGKPVEEIAFSQEALESLLTRWRKAGHKRVALVTRSQKRAEALSKSLKGSFLLTGDVDELEDEGVIVSALHLMKGLEFDAVAVIWPEDCFTSDEPSEKRKLYTACSRALHELAVLREESGDGANG